MNSIEEISTLLVCKQVEKDVLKLNWDSISLNYKDTKHSILTSKMPVDSYEIMPNIFLHTYADGSRAVIDPTNFLKKGFE